jgi:predicted nucleic acid-binding protein
MRTFHLLIDPDNSHATDTRTKAIEWLASDVLNSEIANNPYAERRYEVEVLLSLATETLSLDRATLERAKELKSAGYGAFDALHLSVAESGSAAVFLTTDDRFIKLAARGAGSPRIRILNPVEWLREFV